MIAGDSSFRLRFARNDMGYWGTYRLRFLTCVRNDMGRGMARGTEESVPRVSFFFIAAVPTFVEKQRDGI